MSNQEVYGEWQYGGLDLKTLFIGSHVQEIEELLDIEEREKLWPKAIHQDEDEGLANRLPCRRQLGEILYDEGPPDNSSERLDQQIRRREKFLKDFQLDHLRNSQYLSECANNINREGYIKVIPDLLQAKMIIHRQDKFPNKEPRIWGKEGSKNSSS